MKKEVKVPSVGESITSGTVVSWLKHSGDEVRQGENLFELETDKAVLEIPSPDAGKLETLVEEGTEVAIGQTVATLISDGEAAEPPAPRRKAAGSRGEESRAGQACRRKGDAAPRGAVNPSGPKQPRPRPCRRRLRRQTTRRPAATPSRDGAARRAGSHDHDP